ncbi:MAG TPA: TIGR01777 family oxidoreductase [Nitrospiria bacterium]|nr:TIGR01777 family oxidoreductase [Nitrospiria bacterium]
MKIVISGSSGLIGKAVISALTSQGDDVMRLTRPQSGSGEVQWDPARGEIDRAALEGSDVVIHLAGESIASGRWTKAKKERIYRSRVDGTRLLVQTLLQLERPPKTLLCASAIGFYGERGSEPMTEENGSGSFFISGLCRDWEEAARPALDAGIRVVNLRFGIVLSAADGALAKMLLPFRLGLGGKIGSGGQYMSWVSIDDVVGVIQHAIKTETLSGPVNVVAPEPVTNEDFTKTLGRVLGRPTFFPIPAFAARLAFGEMADELLLASTRVEPLKLQKSGYPFRHPRLEGALRALLGRE